MKMGAWAWRWWWGVKVKNGLILGNWNWAKWIFDGFLCVEWNGCMCWCVDAYHENGAVKWGWKRRPKGNAYEIIFFNSNYLIKPWN